MEIIRYTANYANLTKAFHCGNAVIDNFLQNSCALDDNQGITYIMLSDEQDVIIGYYNIEVGRLDQIEIVGEREYYKPMGGTVNINYLAIHSDYQRIKIAECEDRNLYLGDYLLRDCEKRIKKLREKVGISFVTICSTQQGYYLYHDRNDYEDFDCDMSNFVDESNAMCYKAYKWVDDIIWQKQYWE